MSSCRACVRQERAQVREPKRELTRGSSLEGAQERELKRGLKDRALREHLGEYLGEHLGEQANKQPSRQASTWSCIQSEPCFVLFPLWQLLDIMKDKDSMTTYNRDNTLN